MDNQEVLIDIRERLVRVETKLDNQTYIKEKLDCVEKQSAENEARSKSNTHQIAEIKANLNWLWRTIAGAIIAAGVGAAVIFK